jgi:hypothetical protein
MDSTKLRESFRMRRSNQFPEVERKTLPCSQCGRQAPIFFKEGDQKLCAACTAALWADSTAAKPPLKLRKSRALTAPPHTRCHPEQGRTPAGKNSAQPEAPS